MYKLIKSIVFGFFVAVNLSAQSDIQIIKQRVVDQLLSDPVDDQSITEILKSMSADGRFPHIRYEDLSRRAGFPHREHTSNLVHLARAFNSNNSKYYKKESLLESITRSLTYWVEHDFFGDNWHNNQISTPTHLVNLMLLIGDQLPANLVEGAQPMIGRAHMNASGARPSGDRIVIAGILAKNQLFINDQTGFDETIRIIEGEVKFSTGQRGMQHDYSFHHRVDRVNNTTSYGYGKYANAFGEWAYYVRDTQYAFDSERLAHLIDYYLEGIYIQQVYGIYPDVSVQNRSITIRKDLKPYGTLEIDRLLACTDYRNAELKHIKALRLGRAQPDTSFCKFFWQTEHFVCQRPHYYTTVRMYSTRNMTMEVPYNGPGKVTHHRADATNYISLSGDEYDQIWPVYDWQKISGTTIMQKPELPDINQIRLKGLSDFVGAATDGHNGVVTCDFISSHDQTQAKKAWFFFADEFVCLGNSIYSRPKLPVFTTVDQALLQGPVQIYNHGTLETLSPGAHTLSDFSGVYHNRIGFFPLDNQAWQLSNQKENGRWSDITDQKFIDSTLMEKEVFALWYDHGESPDAGSYAYRIIPGISTDDFLTMVTSQSDLEVLSNTDTIQAVYQISSAQLQAVFYQAASLVIPDMGSIGLETPGAIMMTFKNEGSRSLVVSDPSRKLGRMICIVPGTISCDHPDVHTLYDTAKDQTEIQINLPRGVWAGQSVEMNLLVRRG